MEKIYCGKGKIVSDWKIGISVCLDDIPEEFIKTGKNGKRYVNLNLCERKSIGKYGETHYLEVNTWQPDGSGKSGSFKNKQAKGNDYAPPESFQDDIPF